MYPNYSWFKAKTYNKELIKNNKIKERKMK